MKTGRTCSGSRALLPVLCGLAISGSLLGPWAVALSKSRLVSIGPPVGAGVLLIANPHMDDPNFSHTVVLICQHGPEGTVGLVLNRPTEVSLAKALPEIPGLQSTPFRLYVGGPVQPTGILLLLQMDAQPSNTRPVLDHIFWGGNVEALTQILQEGNSTQTFRAYAGHAGWAPGQLESELAAGAWATLSADPAAIFTTQPEDLWEQMLEALRGPSFIRAIPRALPPTAGQAG
jgi:putative transcriptional regulator